MNAGLDGLPLFAALPSNAAYPLGVPVEVCTLFEQIALDVKAKGFARYSARAILHRIRWHHHLEKGNREFKANNNWTPAMARWVIARHPEMKAFFELRSSPISDD